MFFEQKWRLIDSPKLFPPMRTITLSAKLDERRKKRENTNVYIALLRVLCCVGMGGRHNKNLSLAGTTIFRSKNLKRKIIKERFIAIKR